MGADPGSFTFLWEGGGGGGGVQLENGGTDGWLTQTWKANNEAIT